MLADSQIGDHGSRTDVAPGTQDHVAAQRRHDPGMAHPGSYIVEDRSGAGYPHKRGLDGASVLIPGTTPAATSVVDVVLLLRTNGRAAGPAEFGVQATEFVDAAEWVVVCLRLHGRGKASGAEFEEHEVHASRLRDGKIVEIREYRTKEQALEAAGLSE